MYAVQEMVPKFANVAPNFPVNAMHFREWKKHWSAAEEIALLDPETFNLTSGGEPERVNAARISANLFPLLGVHPQIGRGFLNDDETVVLLSDSIWRRRFHADPRVLGQTIILNDKSYQVAGVMPAGMKMPRLSQLQGMHIVDEDPDVFRPIALRADEGGLMGDFNFGCIVRLKPGVSAARALEELDILQAQIVRDMPDRIELRASLVPLQQQLTGRSRTGLLLLLGAVGAVLLIVCVNIANLMLARSTGRRREFAVRAAVGASSGRLLRQMLTESLVIAESAGCWELRLRMARCG